VGPGRGWLAAVSLIRARDQVAFMLLLASAWASASLARYGLGRLSGLGHRDVLCRGILCREILSRETDGPGG
jgi:hypothetical protein